MAEEDFVHKEQRVYPLLYRLECPLPEQANQRSDPGCNRSGGSAPCMSDEGKPRAILEIINLPKWTSRRPYCDRAARPQRWLRPKLPLVCGGSFFALDSSLASQNDGSACHRSVGYREIKNKPPNGLRVLEGVIALARSSSAPERGSA